MRHRSFERSRNNVGLTGKKEIPIVIKGMSYL